MKKEQLKNTKAKCNRYPMYNKKSFDELRKKEFDYWKEQFIWAINTTNEEMDEKIKEVIAWNCAFCVSTKEI